MDGACSTNESQPGVVRQLVEAYALRERLAG
jgi:hypothetical protein